MDKCFSVSNIIALRECNVTTIGKYRRQLAQAPHACPASMQSFCSVTVIASRLISSKPHASCITGDISILSRGPGSTIPVEFGTLPHGDATLLSATSPACVGAWYQPRLPCRSRRVLSPAVRKPCNRLQGYNQSSRNTGSCNISPSFSIRRQDRWQRTCTPLL